MAKRKTHEEFIREVKIKNPNVEILGQYKNASTKIKCRCKIDNHEWETRPSNLLSGYGCPVCGEKARVQKRTKTHEQFVEELKQINPNVEILGQYKNNKTKIKCRCKIDGHEWEVEPNTLFKGSGCPVCGGNKRKTTKEFIEEIKQINPNVEILGEYKNSYTKIKCRCKVDGHEWSTKPNSLLKGSGCPVCGWNIKSHEQFVKEIKEINADIEILGEYINDHTKIKVRCKTCGHIWEVLPNSLLKGCGCPHKHISKGERKVKDILTNQGIEFIFQHKFEDCKFKSYLPFDFYLPNQNICIEYDGGQHYEIVDMFGGFEGFVDTKIRDTVKTKYCEDHNIKLIRIPYWELGNIEEILTSQLQN